MSGSNQETDAESNRLAKIQAEKQVRRMKAKLKSMMAALRGEDEFLNKAQLDALSLQLKRFFAFHKYYGITEHKTDGGHGSLVKLLHRVGVDGEANVQSLKNHTVKQVGLFLAQKRNRIVISVKAQLKGELTFQCRVLAIRTTTDNRWIVY